MILYDILSIILIGISHVVFYFQLIRYRQLSYPMTIIISIIFTILLGIVVTMTGYPEFNVIMYLIFLLSLGLMQSKLSFTHNLYFTLASMVSITLIKVTLVELGMHFLLWSPFNLYIWSASMIHFIVSLIILSCIVLLRKPIQQFASFVIEGYMYYISFILLVFGLFLVLILTNPTSSFLANLHQQYSRVGYTAVFVLFFILLLIVLIGFHLTKDRLIEEQQEELDRALLDYVNKLEVMHDELANFRHDYINLLLTLDEGIRKEDINQVKQIYHDVIAPTSELISHHELDIIKLSHVYIHEIKSVLSAKVIDAQQKSLHVMIDIPKPIEKIAMPMVNFIRIISILIDNAVEEAIKTEEKSLQIAFFEQEDKQYFIIRNSTRQEKINLEQIYQKDYSSKEMHDGYGLYSLKHIIDKATNVTLETSLNDFLFTQTVTIKR